jgi:cell division protein FtsW
MSRLFSRTDRSFLARWWWTLDRGLLAAFLLLAIIGVVLGATASPPVAERIGLPSYYFLMRHVAILVPALILMAGVSMLEARWIWRVASVIFILGLIGMALVLWTGPEIKGAQRWVHVLGFSLQPSEFVKPAFAIASAWFMALQKRKENFPGSLIAAGLYAATITLLLMQPDLGMTFVITMIWASQIFLAGFRFRLLAGLAGAGAGGLAAAYFAFDHVHSRVDRFFNPDSGDNYQVQKSIEAFQNGGLFGTGPGQGAVKLDLPDAHADFIFSVAGEELGLIFILLLISLYGFILLRGFNRLMESENIFTVLAAGGLLTMLGLQAMVHMGSALNILPAKGMTLPFISYGGSSLLSVGFSTGAILALTRRSTRSAVSKAGLSLRPRAREAAASS